MSLLLSDEFKSRYVPEEMETLLLHYQLSQQQQLAAETPEETEAQVCCLRFCGDCFCLCHLTFNQQQ